MHKISLSPTIIDRVTRRRGKEHIFDDFTPAKTALVVVDMQNAFMLPGVGHNVCQAALDIVPNINRLARAARAAGGTVVWIQTVFTEETLSSWSIYYDMVGAKGRDARAAALTRGGKGYEIWDALEVLPEDLRVEKNRFSAFIGNSSDLAAVLRRHGLDTILVTGTVTNVCCESTARDAMMLNFKTIMVSDGNAAATDEDHNASLNLFYSTFGDVMSTDQLAALLERKEQAAAE